MATINTSGGSISSLVNRAVLPSRQAVASTAAAPATAVPIVNTAQLQNEIETRAQQIASEIIKQQAQQSQVAASGRVFTRFDVASDIIENQKTYVTTGLFSGNAPSMSVMYTGSLQSSGSKNYYYEVWNGTASTSEAQFSVEIGRAHV